MEVSFRWFSFSIFSIRGIFRFLPLIFHGVLFSGLAWPSMPKVVGKSKQKWQPTQSWSGGQIFPDKFSSCLVPNPNGSEKNQGVFHGSGRDSLRVFQDLEPPPLKGNVLEGLGRFGSDFLQNGTEPREGRCMELQSGWIFIQRQHQRLSPGQLKTSFWTGNEFRDPIFLLGMVGFHLEGPTKKSGLEKHENIWKHHFRRDWLMFLFLIEEDVVFLKPFCLRWEGSSMGEGFALSWAGNLAKWDWSEHIKLIINQGDRKHQMFCLWSLSHTLPRIFL